MAKQAGFTLLECMVVIAMLSILAYGANQVIQGFRQSQEDKKHLIDDLQTLAVALMATRQYAIRSGQPTYLCSGQSCSGDWSSGYRIQHTPTGDDFIQEGSFSLNLQLHWQGFPSQRSYIEFLANGLSAYQNGRFVFCVGDWRGDIVLNQSGRFYLSDIVKAQAGCS